MEKKNALIRDLTTGSVPKTLLTFSMPLFLSGLLQMVYNMVDTWFISLTGSPDLESIAAAYGMKFLHLNDEKKMEETIKAFLEKDESVLLQCDVDPNEVA